MHSILNIQDSPEPPPLESAPAEQQDFVLLALAEKVEQMGEQYLSP